MFNCDCKLLKSVNLPLKLINLCHRMTFYAVTQYCITPFHCIKSIFHLDWEVNKNKQPLLFFCSAPSPITVVKRGKTAKNSIAVSWQEPDRPNGIILEYEIKYFEKVITGGQYTPCKKKLDMVHFCVGKDRFSCNNMRCMWMINMCFSWNLYFLFYFNEPMSRLLTNGYFIVN